MNDHLAMPKGVPIRMTLIHNKDGYPVDYTAQNAREFNALNGIELIDARGNQNGQFIGIFDLAASYAGTDEQHLRPVAGVLVPTAKNPRPPNQPGPYLQTRM